MSDKHRQQLVATWIPDSCVGKRPIVYPAACPIDRSTIVYSTEPSGEQPRYKRMKDDPSVESTRDVLSCPNHPLGVDVVMTIDPKDEHFKEKETMDLEKLSRRVCDLCSSPLVRSLIDSFVTEERGHTHKDRMDLIKSVLSISLVYWMDTNLSKIVNLRTFKLEDWPPQLVIKYSTRKKHDLEDLTKELQTECLAGTLDQYYHEIAFQTIKTLQFENEHRLPKNVDGAAEWCEI